MRPGVRLGVDVGSVRVGLAACDPSGLVASPVQTLARDGGRRRDVAAIAATAREREALEVVVGLPLSLSGEEGPAAALARRYADQLVSAVAPTAVRLVDERLTTVSAHQAMTASGRSGRRQREVVDQVAAVIILQAALDRERATGLPAGELVGAVAEQAPADQARQDEGSTLVPRRPRKPRQRRAEDQRTDLRTHHDEQSPRHGGAAADDHGGSVETPWTA